jgi:tetratricopeptide (TPR) repeat protein
MLRAASRLVKPSSMRGALIVLVLFAAATVAAAPRSARKKPASNAEKSAPSEPVAKPVEPPPPPRAPGPDDGKAVAILDRIVAGPDAAARKAAIAELNEIAPRAIEAIGEWLHRDHKAEVADRRAVLVEIKAAVPDKTGKFSQPARQTGKEQKADDEVDWQTELLALDASMAALGDATADDAAIRALAATKDVRAAQVIFDTAFGADTMIYRDECGRFLRRMEPTSIPALTLESMAKDYDRRRYATWQLERLDRQEPGKALDAALGDEALTIAILDVFRKTHHREAVHAVWRRVDAEAPRVRAAARAAWTDYITGPSPPPAPVAKLNLPGGKKTKKPKPLWLTYRELADNELRKAANELLHEDYPLEDPTLEDEDDDHPRRSKTVKVDLEDLTRRLLAYYDTERAKQEAAQWDAAKKKAQAGDVAAAVQMVDRMLATNPERHARAEMAKLYLSWGKELEAKHAWGDAAAAYSKAHGLDPKGAEATEALAAHHFTLGKALEGQGKDGGPDFRRAVALKPDYAPARSAADEVATAGRPVWMLYTAAGAAALAMVLFAAAMMRRRA